VLVVFVLILLQDLNIISKPSRAVGVEARICCCSYVSVVQLKNVAFSSLGPVLTHFFNYVSCN